MQIHVKVLPGETNAAVPGHCQDLVKTKFLGYCQNIEDKASRTLPGSCEDKAFLNADSSEGTAVQNKRGSFRTLAGSCKDKAFKRRVEYDYHHRPFPQCDKHITVIVSHVIYRL